MWQKLQTYLFVSIITVLVWLYAEGENLTEEKLYPDIEFVAPAGRQLLIVPRQPSEPVLVTVRGPTTQLARLNREESEQPLAIELLDDPSTDNPNREVDLLDALSRHPRYADLGIEIAEVTPRRVTVRVERYVPRDLPVEAPPPGDFQFNETPIVEPAQATVRMPASDWANIPADVRVIAELNADDLAQREVNKQHVLVNVPLVLPQARGLDRVTIAPTAATVTLTVTQKTKKSEPQSIPIKLLVPIGELARYDVQLVDQADPWLSRIVFSGPNETIDRINKKEVKVWAELRLDSDDLGTAADKESASAPVHLTVPPGVNAVEHPQPIKFRVVRRALPATSP